ncbi:MAG: hypothetical protein K8T90_17970 [Planctomycetes bacterium]|nr:hypothetical protein [Planctomycetota bacterium]
MTSHRTEGPADAAVRVYPRAAAVVVSALVFTVAFGPGAALAVDSVDLEVGPRDKVRGTLRPSDERETFVVAGLRGTKVAVVAKRDGATGPRPAFEMLDAALANVVTAAPTSSGARLRGMVLGATGDHSFRVTGDGADGDYRLDLTLTPQKTWTGASSADLVAGGETTFAFAAPAGAAASIELRPAKGSAFVPLLLDVTDATGAVLAIDAASAAATRHRATVTLGAAGEHTVRLRNQGVSAGSWTITVRLRFPSARRTTVDLRDEALGGDFDGAQAVFGRIADADASTTIEAADGLGLDGLSITVPSGSLAFPALISMTRTDSFFVDDTNHVAGTTVSFEPSGTTFAIPASVTVPFDPDAFDDPLSELAIVVEDSATGAQQTIPASSVDTTNSTATFPVSHFSRFQPISPRPRPVRGTFVELELRGKSLPGFGTEITFGRNLLQTSPGPRAAGPGTRTLRRATLAWGIDKGGAPRIAVSNDDRVVAATAEVTDDANVTLRTPGVDVPLVRGRGGDALTAAVAAASEVRLHAMFRGTRGAATRANLVGTWHAQVFDVGAAATAPARTPAGIVVTVASHEFDLAVDADGRATGTESVLRSSRQTFPDSAWLHGLDTRPPRSGTLSPDGPEVVLDMPIGVARGIQGARLSPVMRGDILVGGGATYAGPAGDATRAAVRFVVLVRRSTDATQADLPANLLITQFVARAENRASAPHPLRFGVTGGDLSFAPSGAATLTAARSLVGHDTMGLASMTQEDASGAGTAQVARDGRIRLSGGLPGAQIAPRRSLLVVSTPDKGRFPVGFALPSRPPQSASK